MSLINSFSITRRNFIFGALGAIAAPALLPGVADAGAIDEIALKNSYAGMTAKDLLAIDQKARPTTAGLPDTRGIWIYNSATHEEATCLFWVSGLYDNAGYTQICKLMRDWREDITAPMDPMLLHLLWAIQRGSGFTRPLIINSGYRTPATNRKLRREGAAINSFHMHCKACDLVLDGIDPGKVAEYVHSMKLGGVGYYRTFTHIDTGPVRTW